ncbi:hypothetical protein WR25_15190 [Diploscapter pachys]|uniref:Uncharacterized protein n=1 Tax=Diploscapter pachys TaxID=2018661 RepID=A0A2A2K060_9BILA|nr:hypothetical protein WR25_15190 [Diploscapter pachys]
MVESTIQNQLNAIAGNSISELDNRGPYRLDSTVVPNGPPISRGSSAPYWIIGLAIIIALVCVGLNLGLLSAYICYRRQKSRKQKAHITSIKAPTLHAYNHAL